MGLPRAVEETSWPANESTDRQTTSLLHIKRILPLFAYAYCIYDFRLCVYVIDSEPKLDCDTHQVQLRVFSMP